MDHVRSRPLLAHVLGASLLVLGSLLAGFFVGSEKLVDAALFQVLFVLGCLFGAVALLLGFRTYLLKGKRSLLCILNAYVSFVVLSPFIVAAPDLNSRYAALALAVLVSSLAAACIFRAEKVIPNGGRLRSFGSWLTGILLLAILFYYVAWTMPGLIPQMMEGGVPSLLFRALIALGGIALFCVAWRYEALYETSGEIVLVYLSSANILFGGACVMMALSGVYPDTWFFLSLLLEFGAFFLALVGFMSVYLSMD